MCIVKTVEDLGFISLKTVLHRIDVADEVGKVKVRAADSENACAVTSFSVGGATRCGQKTCRPPSLDIDLVLKVNKRCSRPQEILVTRKLPRGFAADAKGFLSNSQQEVTRLLSYKSGGQTDGWTGPHQLEYAAVPTPHRSRNEYKVGRHVLHCLRYTIEPPRYP
ncbi:hypothetical protein J6590_019055 [Homalodisca vitripennis]|nr:hypothetical protein J6590_019055 [Homalodisca vitripennis]